MNLKLRWLIVLIIAVSALFGMFPLEKKIKLGLDLQGGMHVVLGVITEKAVDAKMDSLINQIKKELKDQDIKYSYVQKSPDGKINIAITDENMSEKMRTILKDNYPILTEVGTDSDKRIASLIITDKEVERLADYAVEQAAQVIRNRIDEFGVSEPLVQRQGTSQILVQLPGVTDPDRAISLIGKTAQLKFHIVDESVLSADAETGNIPFNDIILYQKKVDKVTGKIISQIPYVLNRESILTGDYLVDAEVRISSQFNDPYVWIKFDSAGAKLFEEITAENAGKRLAIVLDENVYSAPTINERIAGGEGQISGNFTMETAKDLAIVLRAGSLPAPVEILENRTVGPSLGQDSIDKGFKAALIGFILVIIFMAFYYKLAGIIADSALIMNFIIIMGTMSYFDATLTLPGIAGLILTIGMSVDANVLIFERIREEIRLGRTPLNGIEAGYEKAMSTIMDANITTLIAAIVLFQFGTGPIKGFAVTLSIGILASMFTAIFMTRTVFMSIYGKKESGKLSI